MLVEPVAGSPWNGWPDVHGIRGRINVVRAVQSPSDITLENNGKIRPQPDRENAFAEASGGDEGIRTLETVSRLHP